MPTVNSKVVTATPMLQANAPLVPTGLCECDVSTAITRGLAEYLSTLVRTYGGNTYKFEQCYYDWPEPEDTAKFPNVLVRMNHDITYDAKTLSGPSIDGSFAPNESAPTERVAEVSEAIGDIVILIRANDPQQLRQLIRMTEKALSPVDWIYGVYVNLPFYYGQRVGFAKSNAKVFYNATDAQRRIREEQILVNVRLMECEDYIAHPTEIRLGLTAT